MGAQQSKTAVENEKALLNRLRSLQFEEYDGGDDYVHVAGEKASNEGWLHRDPEGLALQLTRDWQSKLLEDPKNRYAVIHTAPSI